MSGIACRRTLQQKRQQGTRDTKQRPRLASDGLMRNECGAVYRRNRDIDSIIARPGSHHSILRWMASTALPPSTATTLTAEGTRRCGWSGRVKRRSWQAARASTETKRSCSPAREVWSESLPSAQRHLSAYHRPSCCLSLHILWPASPKVFGQTNILHCSTRLASPAWQACSQY